MTDAQKFFDVMLSLSLEGMTLRHICNVSGLSKRQAKTVMEQYSGLVFTQKIGKTRLIKLRRPRSLKTAYTFYKLSDTTCLRFPWRKMEYDLFYHLSDPQYKTRSINTLSKLVGTTPRVIKKMVNRFQEEDGIICKRGSRVSFTMLGFPLWSAMIIGRIFLMNE